MSKPFFNVYVPWRHKRGQEWEFYGDQTVVVYDIHVAINGTRYSDIARDHCTGWHVHNSKLRLWNGIQPPDVVVEAFDKYLARMIVDGDS